MSGARWLVLTACLLVGAAGEGCVPVEAVEQAREEAAICHGHASDPALPPAARMIGADESRAWRAQHRSLTGDDVPGADKWPALPEWLGPVVAPVTSGEPR